MREKLKTLYVTPTVSMAVLRWMKIRRILRLIRDVPPAIFDAIAKTLSSCRDYNAGVNRLTREYRANWERRDDPNPPQ